MQKPTGQGLSHLLGRFDLDPGDWRPLYYPVEIAVPVALNGIGRGSVSINNMPYIWTRTTHKIIGDTADPSTSNLFNDGMYDINFRDEQTVYQRDFAPADLLFGGYGSPGGGQAGGYVIDMAYPIAYAGNATMTFEVRNRVLRAPADASVTFTVAILMHGIASWGKARSRIA